MSFALLDLCETATHEAGDPMGRLLEESEERGEAVYFSGTAWQV